MNYNKNKTIAFSGHRSEDLPKTMEEAMILKKFISDEVEKSILMGYENFYQGACYGFDLFCASILFELKHKYPQIKVISAVPFEAQAKAWSDKHKKMYAEVLEKSDEVIYIHHNYCKSCYHERNRYMIDRSSKLICYCISSKGGTYYTMKYALSKNLNVVNIADLMK